MIRIHVVKSHPDTDVLVRLGTFNVDARDERIAQAMILEAWRAFHDDPASSGWDDDFREYVTSFVKGMTVEPLDDTPTFDVGMPPEKKTS